MDYEHLRIYSQYNKTIKGTMRLKPLFQEERKLQELTFVIFRTCVLTVVY
jgi:hypothetical protein